MTRRRMMGSILFSTGTAAAGIAWRAGQTGALAECGGAAYEPWCGWPRGSGLLFAARAATLAASPHNTQPWRFRVGANGVDLFADANRTIGTIDPLLREQQIGTGCALENLLIAAEYSGFAVSRIAYDEDPRAERIASILFAPCRSRESTLCQAIPYRHTNRGPYRGKRPIPANRIDEMGRLNTEPEAIRLLMWTDRQSHRRITELIVAASEAIVADREQSRDSAKWYRGTRAAIERHRDGTTLDAQGLSPIMTAIAKLLPEPSPSMADRVFLNNTKTVHCGPGATFGTIAAKTPASKETRVRIGRLWQRMHLWATANGIAMQPLNQIHERIDREATSGVPAAFTNELGDLIGESDWRGVFTFRMGYALRQAKPSPRRDLTECLI